MESQYRLYDEQLLRYWAYDAGFVTPLADIIYRKKEIIDIMDTRYAYLTFLQERTIVIYPDGGGDAVASGTYAPEKESLENALARIANEKGLEGTYQATEQGVFAKPQKLISFTAEVPAPPVEVTLH